MEYMKSHCLYLKPFEILHDVISETLEIKMNYFIASRDPSTSMNLSRPEVCLVKELERFAIHTKKGDEKASIISCSGWFPSLKKSGTLWGDLWHQLVYSSDSHICLQS